jgi:hypothetical protein
VWEHLVVERGWRQDQVIVRVVDSLWADLTTAPAQRATER